MTNISEAGNQLYEKNTVGLGYINNIAVYYQRARYMAIKMSLVEGEQAKSKCQEELDTYTKLVNKNIRQYGTLVSDKDEKILFKKLSASWDQYNESVVKAYSINQSDQVADYIFNVSSYEGDYVEKNLDKLITYNEAQASDKGIQNKQIAQNSTFVMLFIVSGAFVAAIALGLIISKTISKPIKKLKQAADQLALGDTSIDIAIKRKDEIGGLSEAFERVVAAIHSLIDDAYGLVDAAVQGRLSERADQDKHNGDYKKIIEGFNKTLDAVIAPIEEASLVLADVSEGNLNSVITGNFSGDHARIKDYVNNTTGSLKGYIQEISAVLGNMADGDFAQEVISDYKGDFIALKDAINAIMRSFNQMIAKINMSANQVASGTRQLSVGSQTISQGAVSQAGALEQLTVSISEVMTQTRRNAEDARIANELSAQARVAVKEGRLQMSSMQQAMTDISNSSFRIAKITKVIDDIAFQTNILALNAAVEAGRAGLHGKGFAIVADEVRSLAAKSADAARETATLIQASMKTIDNGSQITNQTAAALDSIMQSVNKITDIVSGIALSSGEQAAAISQINTGIGQLSQVVQTNSATSQETAAASEQLSGQAEMLKDMASRFVIKSGSSEDNLGYKQCDYI